MITDGMFYEVLKRKNSYSTELCECMENTVQNLLDNTTSAKKPGMLLGKIQSGKTRTFLGIIGLAFDNSFDVTVILTKGTKALALQTFQRIEKEYGSFREKDEVQIFDIMNLPDNLTLYELNQKIIIIAKKETHNLQRLYDALFVTYPSLSQRNVLIIDDEADLASVGYRRTQEETIEMNKIASQIDEIRGKIKQCSFLEVTATPYSLYLQPDDDETNTIFEPKRPAFTVLVPIHRDYIGGEYYFEMSNQSDSIASYVFEEVHPDELNVLKREDRRVFRIEDALTSRRVHTLRDAIVNFIVGGCIRRIQDRLDGKTTKKFSFIMHTEFARRSHQWQENIVRAITDQLINSVTNNRELFNQLIKNSYQNISQSIGLLDHYIPPYNDVYKEVNSALTQGQLMITVVNSERSVKELLDEHGQLKLRTPLNIFIGGQILDRGITINNLIGFYYGRRPNQFKQDTVLQHSRMYGFRPIKDLTVTRFYTTLGIHQVMQNIHTFDSALRDAFIRGAHNNGIVFIRRDDYSNIVPCSPNKILLSTTTTIRPSRRILPVGFQTKSKTNIQKIIAQIDSVLSEHLSDGPESSPFMIELEKAKNIIDLISQTLEFEEILNWNIDAFIAILEYLSINTENTSQKGSVHCLVRTNRNIKRFKADGSFSDAPDTASTEGVIAKSTAIDVPILMLFKQNGSLEDDWRGVPFWWPVLVTPRNTQTVIFASDVNENS